MQILLDLLRNNSVVQTISATVPVKFVEFDTTAKIAEPH